VAIILWLAVPLPSQAQSQSSVVPAVRPQSGPGLPAPPAATTGSITGTVIDPDGRPVRDALVLVTQAASVTTRARTGEDGRFRADALSPGRYDVHVVLEGFRAEPQPIAVVAGQAREVHLRLRLSAVSESVVVSASRVDVPLSRVADSASVLTHRQIEARQLETVADALRFVPGVSVASNGGRGSVTSLFARGGESDHTLVLVDGVRANTFGGGIDFSRLPSSNIERIEIVRGPGSALFGSDAVGGVVQILTRQGGAPRVDAAVEGGSLGTSRLTASASGSRGNWRWGGAVARIASDGFTDLVPATGERVSNDDYHARQAAGTATWRARGGAELAFSGGWTWGDRGFPGPYGSNPIGAYTGVDRVSRGVTGTRQAAASLRAPLAGGRFTQHAQLSWFDLGSQFTSAYGLSAFGTRRVTARTQTDFTLGASTKVAAGAELQHERASSTYITGATPDPVPILRDLIGVFVEARHQQGSRLTITGGLRAENVRRSALEANPNPFSSRPAFVPDAARALNPKASVAWLAYSSAGAAGARPSWVRLRSSAGTGMRAPDGFEIAFTDNPHLKPERSRSVEAGVESGFVGGQAVVGLTWFANRYEDLIVAVGRANQNASQYRTDNIANARAQGLELAARVRTAWGLDAQLAYTWLDSAVLAVDGSAQAPSPFVVGDALLRRPRHQASIDVVFTRGRLTAYSALGARGRVLDVEPSWGAFARSGLFWNNGFTTVRCGASWRLRPSIEVIGRVDNLFDRVYEETFGFPAPGRAFMAGVRVAAGR
jgi:outer membrane cobalamin receptor